MMSQTSLFRGAALGALLALGFGAAAQAAPAMHHHHHQTAAQEPVAESAGLAAEVEELKAQVSSLEAKLDAQNSVQAQTQAQAQQAQATAQAAASQAQSAQAAADAEIKTIPVSVDQAVAKVKSKPTWADGTTLGATVFYDLTNIDQKSAGVNLAGTPNGVNFDIKRMYIAVDHTFNSVFSANLTTDFTYDSGVSATQLYIKKAYVQAKLNPALIIRVGSADLPWVPFVEGLNGYRYVENVMIDRDKFGASADWGVHAMGSIPMGGLTISYAGSAINGSGYKKPGFIGGANHTDSMDFEGRISAAAAGFTAAIGGYDGKLGKDVQGTATFHDATRLDALIAYVNGPIRLGGEYFHASNWNDVTQANPALTNKTEGWSGWGSFAFTKQLAVFGRYDSVKPKQTTAPTLSDQFFDIGIQFEPVKVADFSLVYKREKISNGAFATQEGAIGGVPNGTYDEVGLFGMFKF